MPSTPSVRDRLLQRVTRIVGAFALIAGLGGALSVAPAAERHATPTVNARPAYDLEVDIRSSRVAGRILLGSSAYAGEAANFALTLERVNNPLDVLLAGTYFEQGFSFPVVAGAYRTAYYFQVGDSVPQNFGDALPIRLDARTDIELDLDVPTIEIAPAFLHNGAAFPQDAEQVAHFFLVPAGSGNPIFIGASNAPPPAVTILPGTYSVVYRYQSGDGIPHNQNAVVARNLRLTKSRPLVVRVRSSVVEMRVTLNGDAFPDSLYDNARIDLVSADGEDRVEFGRTKEQLPARPVIHGSYDLVYRSVESTGISPGNPEAVIARGLTISPRSRQVVADIATISVAGQFRLNGSAPPTTPYQDARIGLRLVGTQAIRWVGRTNDQVFGPVTLIPGSYEAVYDHREGDQMPANHEAVFIEKMSLQSSGTHILDIPAVTVDLSLSHNGNAFPDSLYNKARIYAVADEGSAENRAPHDLGLTMDGPRPITLLPGRYHFIYASIDNQGQIPENRWAKFLAGTELTSSISIHHDFQATPYLVNATLDGAAFPSDPTASAEIFVGTSEEDKVSLGLTADGLKQNPTLLINGSYNVYYTMRTPGSFAVLPVNENAIVGTFTID